MNIGIVGYGSYIPRYRIKAEEIALAHSDDIKKINSSLGVDEKSVPGEDEDAVTLGVQAARNALIRSGLTGANLGAIYVGSESHPYAVKPSATIIGSALGCEKQYAAADFEFACKAGTAALQAAYAQVKSGFCDYALAIGSDTAQSSPGDILEYTAGSAAAAYIIGSGDNVLASLDFTMSISSDTPDFWRRSLQSFPTHMGRFTAEPSYFEHMQNILYAMFEKTNMCSSDFAHVVFHQPNFRIPFALGNRIGFTLNQMETGMLVKNIGNSYSASALIGFSAILDKAEVGERLLLVSYGSGSGCDAFIFTTTKKLCSVQNLATKTRDYIHKKTYLSYTHYQKNINASC